MSAPLLHLLAGPNGAGKSTYVSHVLQPENPLRPFVNADVIAADRWPHAHVGHAYEAARIAAEARQDLLESRRSFITETVFSHPSKVGLIDDALRRGYLVHLHVIMVPLEVTLHRVAFRVEHGGHAVPEDKVRARYDRLWALVAQARDRADQTRFFENSRSESPFRLVATYDRGRLVGEAAWPSWTPADLRLA